MHERVKLYQPLETAAIGSFAVRRLQLDMESVLETRRLFRAVSRQATEHRASQ